LPVSELLAICKIAMVEKPNRRSGGHLRGGKPLGSDEDLLAGESSRAVSLAVGKSSGKRLNLRISAGIAQPIDP
jgi:hypothetical protein